MELTAQYRGILSECNYTCLYCPFAQNRSSQNANGQSAEDRRDLARFVSWLENSPHEWSLQFTPRGEALVFPWYREAAATLSHMKHIKKVVFQTNLSPSLHWVSRCNRKTIALWTTYHPGQVERETFLGQLRHLDICNIRYSVGMVAMKEHLQEIEAMRRALPETVYLWLNAYKDEPGYYDDETITFFESIDPLFRINLEDHASLGEACRTGETVISINGDGTVQRCFFVPERIGNIYIDTLKSMLRSRPCPNNVCDCHIGYVHLDCLGLYNHFGENHLERIFTIEKK